MMAAMCARERIDFFLHLIIGEASATACAVFNRDRRKQRENQRGTRCVANAHLAKRHHIARQLAHHIHARLQRRHALHFAHRRREHAVACARRDFEL